MYIDAKEARNTKSHLKNIKHKRLHINQQNKWAIGADLGRPSITQAAEDVVIRITCAQSSHFSDYPEVSKNAQLWCKITSSL